MFFGSANDKQRVICTNHDLHQKYHQLNLNVFKHNLENRPEAGLAPEITSAQIKCLEPQFEKQAESQTP